MTEAIGFTGEYEFLSNFSPSEVFGYPTVEHYYQAMKSLDPAHWDKVRSAATPNLAKKLGRRCDLRPDWEQVKEQVMLTALRAKFADPTLAEKLLATDGHLEEANTWGDRYWGTVSGKGKNRLGMLLMQVRSELRGE